MKFAVRDAFKLKNPVRTLTNRRILKHKTRSSGVSFVKDFKIENTYLQPDEIHTYFQPDAQFIYNKPL
jgi:hypothetical protein